MAFKRLNIILNPYPKFHNFYPVQFLANFYPENGYASGLWKKKISPALFFLLNRQLIFFIYLFGGS